MMKNYYPIIAITAAAYGIIYWLKKKANAGSNLKYEGVDIAIDFEKTKQSFFTQIFYKVKLNLINIENVSVNIKSINLKVFIGDQDFGSIVKNQFFSVPAKSSKLITLETSFKSLAAIELIKDIILEGFQDPIIVKGYINTDLGKVNIDFKKNVSGGISAPNLLLQDKYSLSWKNHKQPTGTKLIDVYKYMLNSINTGAKPHEFNIHSSSGATTPGQIFLEQVKFMNFEPFKFSAN